MRVLFWTGLFWPEIGGVQMHAAWFLPAMEERGYEFEVVTSHGTLALPARDEYGGIPVHRFPFYSALATGNAEQLVEALQGVAKVKRAFKPELVHVNFSDPSVFFHLHTARAHPAPWLFSLRQSVPNAAGGRKDSLLRRALLSADWVTSISETGLADLVRVAPEITDRSSVIYGALEQPDLTAAPLGVETPKLLCLGRVVEDKGFDLALTAFASLAERFPQARLVIAGDGPARPALERQATELGVAERVRFTGWVAPEEVPALLNEVFVLIVPSRWLEEGLPNTAIQAAQMGRPLVGTRVGGLPEAIVHGDTGLLVEREDSEGLAEAIAYLLERPQRAAEMGQAARRRADEVFGAQRHLDTYEALYRKLAASGLRPSL
jgi:glycogen(starch) synthase